MARSSSSDRNRSGFLSHFRTARRPRDARKSKLTHKGPDLPRVARSWVRSFAFALAIIAAAVLIVVVVVLAIEAGSDDVDPAHKLLELTSQDIDPETTVIEKNLLKANQIDARLAAALWRDARRELSGPSFQEAERALREGHVNPDVQPFMKQLAADFGAGKAAVFTIWVAEDESQRGNAVDLQLDGAPLGRFSIEQSRYAIAVVGRTGKSFRLEIIGASSGNRGAVFRAQTATSEAETRHLQPGRNDTWQLVFK
jgi:hypothetical protein